MIPCEYCGRETPDEAFCTFCGAHRSAGVQNPRGRPHRYAAHPEEHVSHPSIVTTLFPHLASHRVHEFRWALLGGVAVVVGLVSGGLVVASILTAAVLVPVLYLVYLYESQVYEHEPLLVMGLSIGSGAALGVGVTLVADIVISQTPALLVHSRGDLLIASTVVLPIVQEVLKPLPVLALRTRRHFAETIDGLVFGVAAGLGFAAAETIIGYVKVISNLPMHTTSANWLFPVLSVTILTPLMQGSCTGAVVASLWRVGRGRSSLIYAAAIPAALVAHVGFRLVSQVLANQGANEAVLLVWQAAVVVALLVYIRFLVHRALLEEAGDLGMRLVVCRACRLQVTAASFCPHCGAAVTAGPRRAVEPVAAGGEEMPANA